MIDGAALRIDDKLRVAKERREEQEKQQGEPCILFCFTSLRSINTQTALTKARFLCDQCSGAWVSDSRAGA